MQLVIGVRQKYFMAHILSHTLVNWRGDDEKESYDDGGNK
jgi:hypothetical protein